MRRQPVKIPTENMVPIRVKEDDPKLKDEREMQQLLDLKYEGFTAGKLEFIEPEKWKNVGVSVIHACKLIKEHQIETAENMAQVKSFIDKFQAKVFAYMKATDSEMMTFKAKMTRDMQNCDR